MQGTLTKKILKISLLVIFVLIIFAVAFLYFFLKNKKDNFYFDREVYIVFSDKDTNQIKLKDSQDLVKNLGGSGEIYCNDGVYYLTLSVYESLEDAESVKENVSQIFQNVDILKLKIKPLSRALKKEVAKNNDLFNFLVFNKRFISEIVNYQIKYLAGQITDKNIISFFIDCKMKIDDFIKVFNQKETEIQKLTNKVCNEMMLYIDNFLANFFESSKKNSLVTSLAVNIVTSYLEYMNNL